MREASYQSAQPRECNGPLFDRRSRWVVRRGPGIRNAFGRYSDEALKRSLAPSTRQRGGPAWWAWSEGDHQRSDLPLRGMRRRHCQARVQHIRRARSQRDRARGPDDQAKPFLRYRWALPSIPITRLSLVLRWRGRTVVDGQLREAHR